MQFDLQVFFIIFSALFVPRTQKATSSRFLSPGAIQSAPDTSIRTAPPVRAVPKPRRAPRVLRRLRSKNAAPRNFPIFIVLMRGICYNTLNFHVLEC